MYDISGTGIIDSFSSIKKDDYKKNKNTINILKIVIMAIFVIFIISFIFYTCYQNSFILAFCIICIIAIIGITLYIMIILTTIKYNTYLTSDNSDNSGIKNSMCKNINIIQSGNSKIVKLLITFLLFIFSLLCFFESYTTNKYLYKDQLVKYNFNGSEKKGLRQFLKFIGINHKIDYKNIIEDNTTDSSFNEIDNNKYINKFIEEKPGQSSGQSLKYNLKGEYVLTLLTSTIGLLSPFLKLGFEVLFMWLYFIFYIPFLIIIRYLIYFISTILYKYIIKGKGKGKLTIIKQILSIFFEKHISYFEIYSKYTQKDGVFKNSTKINEEINENIKSLNKFSKNNEVNYRSGLNQLPFGLPFMSLTTIITKIVSLIYHNIIINRSSKKQIISSKSDGKLDKIKINTSDIFYLNFLLDKTNIKDENI